MFSWSSLVFCITQQPVLSQLDHAISCIQSFGKVLSFA